MSDSYGAEIVRGPVVKESAIVPAAALISITRVAVAVIDATVEADGLRPIAGVKNETALGATPIRRCPQQARSRRLHPRSRYPIIVADVFTPGPEPGHPEIALRRNGGLGIGGNGRRRRSDLVRCVERARLKMRRHLQVCSGREIRIGRRTSGLGERTRSAR